MIIRVLLNCLTKEKSIVHSDDLERKPIPTLACGVYKYWLDLECKECNGTGGEEVSGGHKKECENCSGSGLDPVKLNQFEEAPLSNHNFGGAWTPHSKNNSDVGGECKKCLDYWEAWVAIGH